MKVFCLLSVAVLFLMLLAPGAGRPKTHFLGVVANGVAVDGAGNSADLRERTSGERKTTLLSSDVQLPRLHPHLCWGRNRFA
ncbi:Hypothetical predicted protein [Podarcis lilfordi]|uniref:Uncharacterized protein n=1 Tax=Podarcis lilfordi TaxID=74358 RepID=A0AA35P0Z5_9SAUR|nr:Hypothetical predicted protein [Podarcis lilfordi]